MHIIELKSKTNFRDLGGAKTTDGRTVKGKMLLRGKRLFGIKALDLLILEKDYNLKTVIDLRTNRERLEKPNIQPRNVIIYNCPLFDEAVAGLSHEKRTHSFYTLGIMPPMEEVYAEMAKGESLERVVEVLKMILTFPDERYSVLFHCSAGKDRTGIIAALLLLYLGVSREEVYEDYLYTNRYTAKRAKLIGLLLLIVKRDKKLSKKIEMYYRAERKFLDSSLGIIEKQFGSIEDFFKVKLGFSEEENTMIKNKFLE